MVSRSPEELFRQLTSLRLKKYQPAPWFMRGDVPDPEPTTPSEWFSKMFPQSAKQYGTPFLELVESIGDGLTGTIPLVPNVDFFASCLGGDAKLGHRVVYI